MGVSHVSENGLHSLLPRMRRTSSARARAHASRVPGSAGPGVHQHRRPPHSKLSVSGGPTRLSDGGVPAGTTEAVRRTDPAVLDRQRAVLRDRSPDGRNGLHDTARLTPALSAMESARTSVDIASIAGDADDARSLYAGVRSRGGEECALTHHADGAVVRRRALDRVLPEQASVRGPRALLAARVCVRSRAAQRGDRGSAC